jgi:Patatin-like phospholipase
MKPVAACCAAYETLAKQVFGREQRGKFRYNVDELETVIAKVLGENGETCDTPLLDERHNACKTFVVAKRNRAHDSGAVLFKSYKVDGLEIPCTIFQSARATSAAPTYFPEIIIENNSYVDGGIGYNNPAREGLKEANRIWPNRKVGCLISVGAGLMEPVSGITRIMEQLGWIFGGFMMGTMPLTAEKLTVAGYCSKLATDCQSVHFDLLEEPRLQQEGQYARYYRLSVISGMANIGLQEASRLNEISEITDAYINSPEIKKLIFNCVALLASGRRMTG